MSLRESGRALLPPFVYARLPRAGLGNKMLVWGRAFAFARANDLPLVVSPWTQIMIGPLLRRERSARWYRDFFQNPQRLPWLVSATITKLAYRTERPSEPTAIEGGARRGTAYVFDKVPSWRDYFEGIRDHRQEVRQAVLDMLHPRPRAALDRLSAPAIGVHVRRGDFRPLAAGENFAQVGLVRCPIGYFVDLVVQVRAAIGRDLSVTVFSDGSDAELSELLALPDVHRAQPAIEIVDMLHVSRSSVLITAAGSSFSAWGGFLADAPVIHHHEHFHGASRPEPVNRTFFEGTAVGPCNEWPALLRENLRALT